LMTQQHEEKVCPPIPAVIAPLPTISSDDNTTKPATAPVEKKLSSFDAEEKDRLSEEQKQLLERKKNLASQLQDSDEIIKLKEQQIKELEEKLKQ